MEQLLSPIETICMTCQILFSGENKKKYFKMSSAENFTLSVMYSVKSGMFGALNNFH